MGRENSEPVAKPSVTVRESEGTTVCDEQLLHPKGKIHRFTYPSASTETEAMNNHSAFPLRKDRYYLLRRYTGITRRGSPY